MGTPCRDSIISKIKISFLSTLALLFLASCGAGNGESHAHIDGDTIALKYATNLTMVDHGDYIKVDFRNPWDTTRTLQSYLLIPKDQQLPSELPKGVVVRTPLDNSIVYTTVHSNLIDELGSIDAIKGVCDAQYLNLPIIKERIKSGEVADCGASMIPNIEKILQLKPDAILLSAYENSNDHNKVDKLGIPIIDCIDYMESSPLARAEWMRFFGLLYGKRQESDSLFQKVESEYYRIKELVGNLDSQPIVLTDLIYGQSWDVPGANSTTGVLIRDAGGRSPFDIYKQSGGVRLSPEEVLYRAKDADVWILKYTSRVPYSLSELKKENPLYTKFKAYADGNVYACNTSESTYFEDASFHPHWILAEYARLFHPGVDSIDSGRSYFTKLEP